MNRPRPSLPVARLQEAVSRGESRTSQPNFRRGTRQFAVSCRALLPGILAIPFALALPLIVLAQQSKQRDVSTQAASVARSQERGAAAPPAPEAKKLALEIRGGPQPQWIWGENAVRDYWLTKSKIPGGAVRAELVATCDNRMELFINDRKVLASDAWENPVRQEVTKYLDRDQNTISVRAGNAGGIAGFLLKMVIRDAAGKQRYVVSDASWVASEKRDAADGRPVKTLGAMGVGPWGDVLKRPASLAGGLRDVFQVLPGFQVELLYSVPKNEQGSWVSMTFDDRGRILASDQGGKGLFRITPPPVGKEAGTTKVEPLDLKITSAQGLLHAFGSLYISVNGGPGSGLYRARDTNGDDQYDELRQLKALRGGGEHGPHAIRLAPDGKSLLVIAGNHTDPPADFAASQVPSNWSEDLLLPRQWDARGHARGKLAPGGWIARTDPDGKSWEIVSIGYRNPYDMDLNADGELFAYDADMEWDMGTPWYRPTRVVHATGGSEFGWRSGTGKWPEYYVDSLPPAVNIGPGSPVGVTFGYGARFPAKYQKALYILDWTFGTMYAVHLKPDGASYRATKEEFVSRTPLPLTDAAVGPDGALYFTIGGRGTQSALYRVTYVGRESTAPVDARNTQGKELRQLRKLLERLHQRTERPAEALQIVWPNLGHADRHIRYAARVALEHQPAEAWQRRALGLEDDRAQITAAVALARQADKQLQPQLLDALNNIELASLDHEATLELLRAYALCFVRMGRPEATLAADIASRLDPLYPAADPDLNRELSRLLVYLGSPKVIDKTLALIQKESPRPPAERIDALLARNPGYGRSIAAMLANQVELQKLHYALVLRNVRFGWTLPQRKDYFDWLAEARKRSGGASYQGFVDNIRKEALANASEAERAALASTIAPVVKPAELPKPIGPGKSWKLGELLTLTRNGLRGRDFNQGRRAYAAARCVVCHRFEGHGGATGPDLTNVAGRFSYRDLADAIIDPNKVISDQYRATNIVARGKVHLGRVVGETKTTLRVLVDPEDASKVVELDKDDIEERTHSKVSLMPKDLLSQLNQDEVLDLLAYLMSRGNPADPLFANR